MVVFTHAEIKEFKALDLANRRDNKAKNGFPKGPDFYALGLLSKASVQNKFLAMRAAKRNELINDRDIKETIPPYTIKIAAGSRAPERARRVHSFEHKEPVTLERIQHDIDAFLGDATSVEILDFSPKDPATFPYDAVPFLIGHHLLSFTLSRKTMHDPTPWMQAILQSPLVMSGVFVDRVALTRGTSSDFWDFKEATGILENVSPITLDMTCSFKNLHETYAPIMVHCIEKANCEQVRILFVEEVVGEQERSLVPFLESLQKAAPSLRSDIIIEIHSVVNKQSFKICEEINKDCQTGSHIMIESYSCHI